ncbi:MAG: T9SS type A sorting domain-containing protein, partial [Flavobacteriales bacterium]
ITAAVAGGTGSFTYSFDGGLFSDTLSWIGLSGGTYMIDVLDQNDCPQGMEVMVVEPEVLSATVSSTDISCNGEGDGSVTVETLGGVEDYSYSLNGGDATAENVFTDLEADTYAVVVTDANGCTVDAGSSDVAEPTAIDVTNASSTEESAAGANDGSIDVDVEGGTGELTYSWSGPDGYTADTQDIDGLASGDYSLTVTDENGCEFEIEVISVSIGISELVNNITVSVYPNPNNGQFNLNFEGLAGESVALRISDAQGRLILDQQFNNLAGSYVHPVDLQSAANGLYYMTFTANGFSVTQKIVKQ